MRRCAMSEVKALADRLGLSVDALRTLPVACYRGQKGQHMGALSSAGLIIRRAEDPTEPVSPWNPRVACHTQAALDALSALASAELNDKIAEDDKDQVSIARWVLQEIIEDLNIGDLSEAASERLHAAVCGGGQ